MQNCHFQNVMLLYLFFFFLQLIIYLLCALMCKQQFNVEVVDVEIKL